MRISTFAATLLFTSSLFAQTRTLPVETNDLIVPLTAASRILIPAAGDTPGGNGTHFRSDIDLINLRSTAQTVQLRWLPQANSGTSVVRTITLPAQSGVSSENFVGDILQLSGLGAIDIQGVTSEGAPDSGALLHATARIWTPQPNDNNGIDDEGTMSQTFPAIAMPTAATNTKTIFGLRRSAQYRLNAGIVNPSGTTQRFRITTFVFSVPTDQSVLEVDLPPLSMQQINLPGSTAGTVQILIENLTGTAGSWHAWGSSVDNESGDAWSEMAISGNS
jgi:hypothetical protein